MTAVLAALLVLTNAARAHAGLPPLKADPRLHGAALVKAEEIRRCGFRHDACGRPWMAALPRRHALGENIARGFPTVRVVEAAWMASPEHRANILSPLYHRMGAAVVGGVWVVEFSS